MIVKHGRGKSARGVMICAGCETEVLHPTEWSDRWLACWCKDPDRCEECGPCPVCLPEEAEERRKCKEHDRYVKRVVKEG